jgi:hypothetical protein
METAYRNVSYFFGAILLLAIVGFFNSYFGRFPHFNGLPDMAHLHAIGFLTWFTLLIIQPLLIRYNQVRIHRLLGKFSYFLVPYILFTIIGMIKYSYSIYGKHYLIAINPPGLYFSIQGAINFTLFYILAMVNKKNTAFHMRYIIVASLALIPPAAGRFFVEELKLGPIGGPFSGILVLLIIIGLIIYDKVKLKKVSKPYIIALIFNLMVNISIATFIPTHAWQFIALKIGQYL